MRHPRPIYYVELDDGTDHRVEVLLSDQLRAELEAPRHGIPVDVAQAPAHHTALWVWSALLRTGVLPADTKFQEARPRMVLVGKVREDDVEADLPVVPTVAGQESERP